MTGPGPQSPGATLTWDDGTRTLVTGVAVFGRNPSVADTPGAQAIAVRDTTKSLSKTHFECRVDARGVWIVDRHSTNGISISNERGTATATPGEPVAVTNGDTLVLGDRTCTVTVVR